MPHRETGLGAPACSAKRSMSYRPSGKATGGSFPKLADRLAYPWGERGARHLAAQQEAAGVPHTKGHLSIVRWMT